MTDTQLHSEKKITTFEELEQIIAAKLGIPQIFQAFSSYALLDKRQGSQDSGRRFAEQLLPKIAAALPDCDFGEAKAYYKDERTALLEKAFCIHKHSTKNEYPECLDEIIKFASGNNAKYSNIPNSAKITDALSNINALCAELLLIYNSITYQRGFDGHIYSSAVRELNKSKY